MITLETSKVNWLYDPTSGVHRYNDDAVVEFLDYVRDCEINMVPSSRYHTLREQLHFWGGQHKFYFGVETEDDARALVERWGGYYTAGAIVDNQFVPKT